MLRIRVASVLESGGADKYGEKWLFRPLAVQSDPADIDLSVAVAGLGARREANDSVATPDGGRITLDVDDIDIPWMDEGAVLDLLCCTGPA
jgi:hypothetical protein